MARLWRGADDDPSQCSLCRDTLDSLPLLDAVLKETLRFHPPVTSTSRWTTEEVAIPLGDEPIEGERGIITEVKIPRGVNVLVRE